MGDDQKPKSLYDVLGETQDFFRKLKMELETGYPYITWRQNIEERKRKDEKRKSRRRIWANVGKYIGAAVIAALPAIVAVTQYYNPQKEPQLRLSTNQNVMVWSYPGEYQARNFKDIKPFGSLDEVVLRTKEGKVVTLHPWGKGFMEQELVYSKVIAQYMGK